MLECALYSCDKELMELVINKARMHHHEPPTAMYRNA